MSNGNKNTIFVEANVTDMSVKFQLHPPYDFQMIFEYIIANLTFQLPWQSNGLDKIHMLGRGLFKEHFCDTFVKISAVG